MTPEQLEDAGWTPEQWTELNELARATVEGQGRVRHIIPRGPDMPKAYTVAVPTYAAGPPATLNTEVAGRPVVRVRAPFQIAAEQLHDFDLIKRMVDRRSREIAQAADHLLINGGLVVGGAGATALPAGVNTQGLLNTTVGLATNAAGAWRAAVIAPPPAPPPPPANILDRLVFAVNSARANSSGPFTAILSPAAWQELSGVDPGLPTNGFRRARIVLGDEKDAVIVRAPLDIGNAAAAANFAEVLMFEPAPSFVDRVVIHEPRLAHVAIMGGDVILRVEEAFFLRVSEPSALFSVV